MKKIQELTGISLNPKALMDVQVKRIHEYKRQLLNLLSIVHRYQHIKSLSPEERKKVCFLHIRFFFHCRTALPAFCTKAVVLLFVKVSRHFCLFMYGTNALGFFGVSWPLVMATMKLSV